MSTAQTQQITPELRRWIVEQAQAGHSAEAVLKSMLASGWNEDVAVEAMEATLRDHLERQAVEQGLPPAIPVPDPELDDSPLYLDAGDRQVCVLQSMYSPRVVVFGGLLSDEECEGLIELAKPRLARSLTVETKTGGEEVNADRTSSGMFFQRGENELVRRIEARIARLLNWPEENGEGLAGAALHAGHRIQAALRLFRSERAGYAHDPQARRPARGHAVDVPRGAGQGRRHDLSGRAPARSRPSAATGSFSATSGPIRPRARCTAARRWWQGEKWIATKWLRERRFL